MSTAQARPALDNRRRCTRMPVHNSSSIQLRQGALQAMGALTDVSADGLAVRTDQPPGVGDRVVVHVLTHGRIEALTGRVVHVSRPEGTRPVVGIHCNLMVLQGRNLLAMALGLGGQAS